MQYHYSKQRLEFRHTFSFRPDQRAFYQAWKMCRDEFPEDSYVIVQWAREITFDTDENAALFRMRCS